jgi:hypothetical protein
MRSKNDLKHTRMLSLNVHDELAFEKVNTLLLACQTFSFIPRGHVNVPIFFSGIKRGLYSNCCVRAKGNQLQNCKNARHQRWNFLIQSKVQSKSSYDLFLGPPISTSKRSYLSNYTVSSANITHYQQETTG